MPHTRQPVRAAVLPGAALALAVAGAGAQHPSSWAVQQVPAGTNPAAISQLGKLIHFVDAGRLRVFSAFTRRWHSAPLAAGAVLRYANDWVMAREPNRVLAFSSMRGTFESIPVSAAATVVNPSAQRNDSLLLVRDGGMLHAFSGLQGGWISLPVSAGARIAVQRQTAVVADGSQVFGLSAFGGSWVSRSVSAPVTAVACDGNVGIADAGAQLLGFSAMRASWTGTASLGSAARFDFADDVAVWSDGHQLLGFSGLVGRFERVSLTGPVQVVVEQQMAVATAGTSTYFFSAPKARWTAFTTATPAVLSLSAATAVLSEPGALHAYSALLGQVTTLPVTASSLQVDWTVVAAVEAGSHQTHFYSAITGAWSTPPPGPPSAFPRTAFNGGLIEVQGGFAAYSARSGRYVSLPAGAAAVAHVDPASALLVVEEPARLSVFEARREVWLHQTRLGTGPLAVYLWRTSMLALESGQAYGYGAQAGEIEPFALGSPVIDQRAGSESARVVTATEVIGFSSVPDVTTLMQFPEFRRLFAPGAPLDIQLRGPAGSFAVAVAGLPAPAPLPTVLGDILLDVTAPAVAFPLPTIGPDGRTATRLGVPADPSLSGAVLAFQGAVLQPAAGGYLTRACGLYLP